MPSKENSFRAELWALRQKYGVSLQTIGAEGAAYEQMRAQFAAAALTATLPAGVNEHGYGVPSWLVERTCIDAWRWADAMMAARTPQQANQAKEDLDAESKD